MLAAPGVTISMRYPPRRSEEESKPPRDGAVNDPGGRLLPLPAIGHGTAVTARRCPANFSFEEHEMTTDAEIKEKFWKSLKSDMTVMLGLVGVDDAHTRPMTAQVDEDQRDFIWFFTSTENELVGQLSGETDAFLTYASKGHDIFAAVHGTLTVDNDREEIDRLWNRFVAAWFEKGKDDPKLVLLRFTPGDAQIWVDASSFVAGIKMFLGIDPKQDYKDKVAKVDL